MKWSVVKTRNAEKKIRLAKARMGGFTLPELLICSMLGMLIMGALGGFSFYTGRSLAAMGNYTELEQSSRNSIDVMTQQIRQTRGLSQYSATSLTFIDHDSTPLMFTYDADARTLSRTKGGQSRLLLDECDTLRFDIFQRNRIEGTHEFSPTTNAATAKLIQVTWLCSRDLIAAKANTETVQSAKIVIRKREK